VYTPRPLDTLNILIRSLHVVAVVFLIGGIAPSHVVAGVARRTSDPKGQLALWVAWLRMGKVSGMSALLMIATGVTLTFTMNFGFFPGDHLWLALKQGILCLALVTIGLMMGPVRAAEKAVQEAVNAGGGMTPEIAGLIKKPANLGRMLDLFGCLNLILALWRPGE